MTGKNWKEIMIWEKVFKIKKFSKHNRFFPSKELGSEFQLIENTIYFELRRRILKEFGNNYRRDRYNPKKDKWKQSKSRSYFHKFFQNL